MGYNGQLWDPTTSTDVSQKRYLNEASQSTPAHIKVIKESVDIHP